MDEIEEPKKKGGCLKYALMGCGTLLLLGLIGGGISGYLAYQSFASYKAKAKALADQQLVTVNVTNPGDVELTLTCDVAEGDPPTATIPPNDTNYVMFLTTFPVNCTVRRPDQSTAKIIQELTAPADGTNAFSYTVGEPTNPVEVPPLPDVDGTTATSGTVPPDAAPPADATAGGTPTATSGSTASTAPAASAPASSSGSSTASSQPSSGSSGSSAATNKPASAASTSTSSSKPASTSSSTAPASSSTSTSSKPASSTSSTSSSTSASTSSTSAPAATSTMSKPSNMPPPPAKTSSSGEKVAVNFSLPSGGKYDGIEVFVDGASLGVKPLRERVAVGKHVFRFYKPDVLDINCPIVVPDTGRSLEISSRKASCPQASVDDLD